MEALVAVHESPLELVITRFVPSVDTATKVPFPNVTAFQEFELAEARAIQLLPGVRFTEIEILAVAVLFKLKVAVIVYSVETEFVVGVPEIVQIELMLMPEGKLGEIEQEVGDSIVVVGTIAAIATALVKKKDVVV